MGILKENYLNERVSLGVIPGVTILRLYGVNGATTTTHETLWDNSSLYVFLQANMSSPTIVSSSANDAAAGTGARTVRITGVDSTFATKTEDVTLNGATPVSLVNNYMSINSIIVLTAGSGLVNAGTLTLAAGGTTHGFMAAAINQTTSFIYTVPTGYSLLIRECASSSRSTTAGGHEFYIRYSTNLGLVYLAHIDGFLNTGSRIEKQLDAPLYFPEKTQIQGTILSSAGTGPCYGVASGWLIDNDANVLGL